MPEVPSKVYGSLEVGDETAIFGHVETFLPAGGFTVPRTIFLASQIAFAFCSAFAQPVFEAASVKPADPRERSQEGQKSVVLSPGRLTMRDVTLKTAIVTAYGVKDFQVSGPALLSSGRFDIVATAAGGAGDEQLKLMLQTLLADRFKLTMHRETKEMPVYALVVAKRGSKLQQAKNEGEGSMRMEGGRMTFRSYSLAQFADFLSKLRSVDRPVLDMTGLTGHFDFAVQFADLLPDGSVEAKHAAEQAFQDPSLPMTMAEQLGLKLETRKAPVETLMIDRAERPSEN